jgi:GH18 family chitinase
LGSGYFPITQTFGSFAICLDEADIAWVHGKARATSVSASRIVIGEALYGRVEIAAVSSSSKCFLPCRHLRFLDQGSTEMQKSMREKPHVRGCKMWHC